MSKKVIPYFIGILLAACQPQGNITINVPVNSANPTSGVNTTAPSPTQPLATPVATPKPSVKPTPVLSPTPQQTVEVPGAFRLEVPFTPQAPFAVWDDLHNEACEEASMIMADAYFDGYGLTQTSAENAIQKHVAWQTQNGYTYDVTAAQVVTILKDYFDLSGELSVGVTVENIIYNLSQGNLIIVPAAGRRLGNPYYKQPGPLYHMMVIIGYDDAKKEFITNDPGTRRGEGYRYTYQTLINAVHDWPKLGLGKDDVTDVEMEAGVKVMVIVSK